MKFGAVLFALIVSLATLSEAQVREPCTNLTDSAISVHYGHYSEAVKRKGCLDSLCFIFELPDTVSGPQVSNWSAEQGIRSWTIRSMSVLRPEADSVKVITLKVPMVKNDPNLFKAIFAIMQTFRRTFNIEHCGLYTKYSLQDLSSDPGRKK